MSSASIVRAAKCEDKSDEEVRKKAAELGILHPLYSCARAKADGACSLGDVAKEFCPKTCELCSEPPPWTWCYISGSFCLASQGFCDSTTKCGDAVKRQSDCRAAASQLGLNSTVTEIDNADAPDGCFQARFDDRQSHVYYNKHSKKTGSGRFSLRDSFFKSLCSVRKTGA